MPMIVGKTNMDEFAMGASTETGAFGVTRNPWDPVTHAGGKQWGRERRVLQLERSH